MNESVEPKRVFIYGSCVSRDTYDFLHQERNTLVGYVPRQSLLTAFDPPRGLHINLERMTSAFQRRVTKGALAGDLLTRLDESAIDLLIWDITDERLGVYRGPSGGFVTRSVELMGAGMDPDIAQQCMARLEFGDTAHLDEWNYALARWVAALADRGLASKTVLLAPPWATRTLTQNRLQRPLYKDARVHNRISRQYYRSIVETMPEIPVWIPKRNVRADPHHKWGGAPFHFDRRTYEDAAKWITATRLIADEGVARV